MRYALLLAVPIGLLFAQDGGLSPREAYYKAMEAERPKPKPKPRPKPSAPKPHGTPAPAPDPPTSILLADLRFGLEYNLLSVDRETGISTEVDPDSNFRDGDCLAVRFTPNRAGRIYVFNVGSSGKYQLMLPSPTETDESNFVAAGATLEVPQNHCLRINPPRGVETLRIVITDEERLIEEMKKGAGPKTPVQPVAPPAKKAAPLLEAQALEQEFGRDGSLAGRDLSLEKVNKAVLPNERPYSVYAVLNSSSASGNRIVIDIKLRHE